MPAHKNQGWHGFCAFGLTAELNARAVATESGEKIDADKICRGRLRLELKTQTAQNTVVITTGHDLSLVIDERIHAIGERCLNAR